MTKQGKALLASALCGLFGFASVWWGFIAPIHEFGHVLGAWLSGSGAYMTWNMTYIYKDVTVLFLVGGYIFQCLFTLFVALEIHVRFRKSWGWDFAIGEAATMVLSFIFEGFPFDNDARGSLTLHLLFILWWIFGLFVACAARYVFHVKHYPAVSSGSMEYRIRTNGTN